MTKDNKIADVIDIEKWKREKEKKKNEKELEEQGWHKVKDEEKKE